MGFKDFFISEDQWGLPTDHLEGLDGAIYKEYVALTTRKEQQYVEIKTKYNYQGNNQISILPFAQIVRVDFVTWEKTIKKPVSPMAEGIVGGILGGPSMAIVSAIDAKGRTTTEKIKVKYALKIQYHPRGDFRTVKSIIVDPGPLKSESKKWAKTLCRCANLPEPQYITPTTQTQGPTYL